MDILKYLLITLLCAVVLGVVFGIVMGKYLVKRAKSERKPLLGKKERFIYWGCAALGVACICFGLFFKLPVVQPEFPEGEFAFEEDAGGGGGAAYPRSGGAVFRSSRGGVGVAVRVGSIFIPGVNL